MVCLNETLLRKRSEHNEGLLSDLEEVALHQHEIERIECVGTCCRHLKILLLQNNIIGKIENLHKLKEMEYLNLAINNISVIENLHMCESLKKLDLTLNFIDFDTFRESLANLESNYNLEDLYLIGNPVSFNWEGEYRKCVIACLPQLLQLDGKPVTRTERVAAVSQKAALLGALSVKADYIRNLKQRGEYDDKSEGAYTRESRVEMYRELGAQKAEKTNTVVEQPKKSVLSVLNHRGEIRQCNEGKYKFTVQETRTKLLVDLFLPKYMDSSLISIEVDPQFVRVVVKGKLTQIRLDTEIAADLAIVNRSKTTGCLRVEANLTNPRPEIPHNGIVLDISPPPLERICA